jgi:hypothetical protein
MQCVVVSVLLNYFEHGINALVGAEHKEAGQQPSFCTLPMFHPLHPVPTANSSAQEYISNDGHSYACRNPALLHQAFHM